MRKRWLGRWWFPLLFLGTFAGCAIYNPHYGLGIIQSLLKDWISIGYWMKLGFSTGEAVVMVDIIMIFGTYFWFWVGDTAESCERQRKAVKNWLRKKLGVTRVAVHKYRFPGAASGSSRGVQIFAHLSLPFLTLGFEGTLAAVTMVKERLIKKWVAFGILVAFNIAKNFMAGEIFQNVYPLISRYIVPLSWGIALFILGIAFYKFLHND